MGRPPNCDCHCESDCYVPPPCPGRRCTDRFGGIGRETATSGGLGIGQFVSTTKVDITPELGEGTASGITVIDHTDPKTVVVCNRAGDIYRTEDHGDDWTWQNLDIGLSSIHSRGSKVLTVGDDGSIFASADQGVTWTAMESGTSEHLFSVWMCSTRVAFACGDNGTVLKTVNSGTTWSILTSGVSAALRAIHFLDNRNGFAVGDAGTVLQTTDGGATWIARNGITDDVDCVLMLAIDNVVMFTRNGTTTRRWAWNGVSLTNVAAGPGIAADHRLSMCGITCEDSATRYLTQEHGCVVCPYHSTSAPVVYRGSRGPLITSSPVAQHQNRDGDANQYTTSVKAWGGSTINSYTLTHDATHGNERPCLRLSVDWSQTRVPPLNFPQAVAPPATGIEPLFGAWVVCELNGGPQITLGSREFLDFVSATLNSKMIAATPTTPASFVRVLGTATAGTWTITVGTETTADLGIDASLTDVESAIGTLPGVDGEVSVSGWPINTPDVNGTPDLNPANEDKPNNGCLYVLKWTDGVQRTVSVDVSGLIFSAGAHGGSAGQRLNNWQYEIVPVVIRDGVVYGPSFAGGHGLLGFDPDGLTPIVGVVPLGAGVETCWRYLSTGPDCGDVGTNADGYQNHTLHSRYRSFLENQVAIPSSLSCYRYCRGEDSFGDWENPTVERYVTLANNSSYNDVRPYTLVPPTLSFDEGDFTVGFAVGFVSDVPGDYSAELLLDNLCLEWGTRSASFCGDDLIVDEPMDSLPGDWEFQPGLLYGCGSGDDFVYTGAEFRSEDGALITDTMVDGTAYVDWSGISPYFWRQSPYGGGSLYKVLDFTGININTSDFCLTVECELEITHERDREWYEDDRPGVAGNPTPEFDLNAIRPTSDFGIFVGGLAKFGVVHNGKAGFNGGGPHDCGAGSFYQLRVDGRIDREGSLITNRSDCDGNFLLLYDRYFCTDGTIGYCSGPGAGCHSITYGSHQYATGYTALGKEDMPLTAGSGLLATPLRTNKLRLEVRWAGFSATVNDCLRNERFFVKAWVNDRPTCLMTHNNSEAVNVAAGTAAVVWKTAALLSDPTVGVYSHRGGKWRNFKAWIST